MDICSRPAQRLRLGRLLLRPQPQNRQDGNSVSGVGIGCTGQDARPRYSSEQEQPDSSDDGTALNATAQALLADMLLNLPMLRINAFTTPKQDYPSDHVQPVGSKNDKFDSIVVPARRVQAPLFGRALLVRRADQCEAHLKTKVHRSLSSRPVAATTHVAEIEPIVPCKTWEST